MNTEQNPTPPSQPVRLIFVHHSVGGNWLADDNGGLGIALRDNNYFVSDTSYGWGPNLIGDRTDIGDWYEWFPTYLEALFKEDKQVARYTRQQTLPPGENEVILFKSCFPNSTLRGDPTAPVPPIERNPICGERAVTIPADPKNARKYLVYRAKSVIKAVLGRNKNEAAYTVANAKGIYIELLKHFQQRPDKLFIAITAPPLLYSPVGTNARAFNQWLAHDWLANYPLKNVAVFDLYNVLTSNGGGQGVNDLGQESGNHHRWRDGSIQHQVGGMSNVLAYPTTDDHPNKAGNQKATAEFVPLLNAYYRRWKNL
ncbi:MAG: hypothetical protein HY865_20155 [Chloroflexi bacterium]|nr:hypothetical protein [Chloroflexota bacterium]